MRPVRLAPDEWPPTPAWKVPLIGVVWVAIVVATFTLPTTAARVSVAVTASLLGAVLTTLSVRRTVRESGDQRISWLRGPAVRRRDVDLLQSASGSAVIVVGFSLNGVPGQYWWVTLAIVAWVLPPLVLQARHNRRA